MALRRTHFTRVAAVGQFTSQARSQSRNLNRAKETRESVEDKQRADRKRFFLQSAAREDYVADTSDVRSRSTMTNHHITLDGARRWMIEER